MPQVLNADYLEGLQPVVTLTYCLHQLQVTLFGLFPRAGSRARWHWHGCYLTWLLLCAEERHMCMNASPQLFTKCLHRRSHKIGCIDPKMQSKSFESRPYLHHTIMTERAQMHPGKGGDRMRERELLRPFSPGTGRGLRAELGNDLSFQGLGCLSLQRKPWPWLTAELFYAASLAVDK